MGLASNNNNNDEENNSDEIQDLVFELNVLSGGRRWHFGWLGLMFGLCTIFVVIYFFGAVFFAVNITRYLFIQGIHVQRGTGD